MYFGYTIDDRIMEYAIEFLEGNRKHFDEISENCIVGGVAVQCDLKERGAYKDYLRPTTDIDILFKNRIKKSDFRKLLEKIKKSNYEAFSIDSRIKRTCFELSVIEGKDKIYIHLPYFTSKRYEKNKSWIMDTVENTHELNIIDFPIESIKNTVKNKTRRSLYCLKKLDFNNPKKYFEELIENMCELIKEDPQKGKEIYLNEKQEIANALEDDGFYSSRVQEALRKAKIYKDAYDIACLKHFYPEYF